MSVNTLFVTYDLNKPGQDYTKLIDHLKAFGTWCHPLDSTWLIRTTFGAADMRNDLKAYIDGSDDLLVVNVTGDDWASYGLSEVVNDWLRTNL